MSNRPSSLHAESLRLAASAARIGFWSWSPPNIFQWDDSLYALMGLDPSEHQPSPGTLLPFVHPDDRHILEAGGRAIMEGEAFNPKDEFRYVGPDGKVRWFEIHRARTPGSQQVVGLIQDITERKRALDALTASEARLELATSAAKIGIWDWDLLAHRMIYCPRAKAICGLAPDQEVTPELAKAVTHPDDLPVTWAQFGRALDPYVRDTRPYAYRIVRPDGTIRRVTAHGAVVFERVQGEMKAVRYAGTLQDVTEHWELERAKEETQTRLKIAVDAGRMAIWEVDIAADRLVSTPELNRLLGFPEGAELTLEELRARYHPGERERMHAAACEALARGDRFFEFEFRYALPDDTLRWLLMRAEISTDAEGEPTRAVGVVMDITERKRIEDHIRLLMREVNHRSKNLLAVVQSVASQTASRGDPADFIQRFGERLQGLSASHDLLVRNSWQGVEISELVRSQLSHFRDLIGRRIRLEGPALHLTATAAQSLGMAFHELATNAGKYGSLAGEHGMLLITWSEKMHEGGRHLSIRWEESGGSAVKPPRRRGFGTLLITDITRAALQAEISLDMPTEGLRWRLLAPAGTLLQA
ncbi:MAG: PAS domain-containing protein [Aestuariivirga sp.]